MNTVANTSLVALKAEILNLTNKVSEIETSERAELHNKVLSLPQYLGVNSMEEAIGLIKKNRNIRIHGNRGSVSTSGKRSWGRGRHIPDNIRQSVQDLLKTRTFTVEEISNRIGVSTATINKIKKLSGLVKQRKSYVPQMAGVG